MQPPSRNGRAILAFRPRPPLDARLTLARYGRWGLDPASPFRDGQLHRVAQIHGDVVPFRLSVAGPPERPRATVVFAGPDTPTVRAILRQAAGTLLGEPWDLEAFYAQAADDPVLGPLVRRDGGYWGFRPAVAPDLFELLVGAISAQQVNLTFALATRARLVRHYGLPAVLDGVPVYGFPTPEVLARARLTTLRGMQFSQRKAEYIVGLARALAGGHLDLAAVGALPEDEVIGRLTRLRGLGRWTAEWFLARGLARPDICPADDLGVRRAMEALCFGGRAQDAAAVRHRARAWRPQRSLAVHYLLEAHHQMRLTARVARGA